MGDQTMSEVLITKRGHSLGLFVAFVTHCKDPELLNEKLKTLEDAGYKEPNDLRNLLLNWAKNPDQALLHPEVSVAKRFLIADHDVPDDVQRAMLTLERYRINVNEINSYLESIEPKPNLKGYGFNNGKRLALPVHIQELVDELNRRSLIIRAALHLVKMHEDESETLTILAADAEWFMGYKDEEEITPIPFMLVDDVGLAVQFSCGLVDVF
jgi:hypothetical protein